MERVLIVGMTVVQKALKRLFEEQGYSAEIRGDRNRRWSISFRREAQRDAVNQRERFPVLCEYRREHCCNAKGNFHFERTVRYRQE
jgi:hypothetical protein